MKKVLKQIGKAIGYFAVYLTCMNVVDLIAGFVWGYSKGKEFKEMGLSPDEAAAAFQSVETGYKGISMLIGAILTLLVFFIIEKVKKTSLAKETDMKKVTGKQMGLTVIGALGGMFFMNFMLSILPIPEELLGDLTSGMGSLTSYPFWLAIIVNAILIPILEEVVFRGYIFSRLGKAMPAVVAAVISSVIFGLCHGGLVWEVRFDHPRHRIPHHHEYLRYGMFIFPRARKAQQHRNVHPYGNRRYHACGIHRGYPYRQECS